MTTTGADGNVHHHHAWDLSYQPKLPPGAVRGDPRAQEFCALCHVPKYFYVDEPRQCLQCGSPFTFGASEQKFWYETLKFNFASTAVRCVTCRRRARTQRAARAELEEARKGVATAPEDAGAQLELARTLVQLRALTVTGNMSEAIAAARKARRLGRRDPQWKTASIETWFWEGRAQGLAGHETRARATLTQFLEHAAGRGRYARQAREAEAWLTCVVDHH